MQVWKQITALVLIVAFTAQVFDRAIIVIDFYANQDYIAKNLCVNRDKPEMKCEGKCYLCKRLQKQQKSDQQNPERKQSAKHEVVSSRSFFATCPDYFFEASLSYSFFPEKKTVSLSKAVFHPPALV